MTILLLGLAAVIVAAFGIALLDVTIRRAEVGAALVFLWRSSRRCSSTTCRR